MIAFLINNLKMHTTFYGAKRDILITAILNTFQYHPTREKLKDSLIGQF